MSRWLKVLPLTLALAALSIFATSCGSSGPAQVRFVQAIQDANPLDVKVYGTDDANGTQISTNIAFLGVQPSQPGYASVPSGGDPIKGFLTGTTTEVFSDSVTFNGEQQYTLVATGFSQTGVKGSNVVLLSIPDDIPSPPAGDAAFRVIHASPSGPGTVDIYILLNPSTSPAGTPAVSGLAYGQASNYVALPTNPNNDVIPPGFTVYVTASASLKPIFSEPINPEAGADRTLVLTDVQGGTSMNTTFLELSDLN